MKKLLVLFLSFCIAATLFTACVPKPAPTDAPSGTPPTEEELFIRELMNEVAVCYEGEFEALAGVYTSQIRFLGLYYNPEFSALDGRSAGVALLKLRFENVPSPFGGRSTWVDAWFVLVNVSRLTRDEAIGLTSLLPLNPDGKNNLLGGETGWLVRPCNMALQIGASGIRYYAIGGKTAKINIPYENDEESGPIEVIIDENDALLRDFGFKFIGEDFVIDHDYITSEEYKQNPRDPEPEIIIIIKDIVIS